MTRLIFVRHAQTVNNVAFVLSSAHPGPSLTDIGLVQARDVAALLADKQVEAIFTSPLLRALETATAISELTTAPVVTRDELRECGVGALEGRGDDAAFARYHEVWDQWLHGRGLDLLLGPEGETGNHALSRMRKVIDQACGSHPEGTVVLVSHGGLLQLAVANLSANLDHSWTALRPVPNVGIIEAEADSSAVVHCTRWCGELAPIAGVVMESPVSIFGAPVPIVGAEALIVD